MTVDTGDAVEVRAPEVDEDAAQVLEECDASTSIARAEGVTTLTLSVLAGLGVGSAAGVVLKECSTATEAAGARKEIVAALMKADDRLVSLGHGATAAEEKARTAVLAVARLVVAIVGHRGCTPGARVGGPGDGTSYVVTQTEEERGFTLPTYSADDVKRQKKNVQLMSNVRVRAHGLPALASMKKVANWVKTESAWPDPRRVPLDAMK